MTADEIIRYEQAIELEQVLEIIDGEDEPVVITEVDIVDTDASSNPPEEK